MRIDLVTSWVQEHPPWLLAPPAASWRHRGLCRICLLPQHSALGLFIWAPDATQLSLAPAAAKTQTVAGAPRSHTARMGDKDPILLHYWHVESSHAGVLWRATPSLCLCVSHRVLMSGHNFSLSPLVFSLLRLLRLLHVGSCIKSQTRLLNRTNMYSETTWSLDSFNNLSCCQTTDFWQRGEGQNKSNPSSCNFSSAH